MILWFYSDKLFPLKHKLAFFLSLNSQAYYKKVLFVILQSFKLFRIDTWINSLFFSSILSTACSRYLLTFFISNTCFYNLVLFCKHKIFLVKWAKEPIDETLQLRFLSNLTFITNDLVSWTDKHYFFLHEW